MEKLIAGAAKLGLHLSLEQIEQFEAYYLELVDWNRQINLTAITDYNEVQIKHFLDSLTIILAWQQPTKGLSVIDIGTGAGIPGIPLKIVFTDIKLVLLDSIAKKAAFLQHIKQKLGLNNVEIVVGRAEEVAHQPKYREKLDIVLSRAVAQLPTLIEVTLPFCTIGGSVIAQKKGKLESEINKATKAISVLGGRLRDIKRVELEEFTDERCLIIIEKVSPTPAQYPRRPGIPAKRPILDKAKEQ